MNKYLPLVLISLVYCTLPEKAGAQTIDFGKSYVNITKGLNGGTIEPGDILEIRASFVVRAGMVDSCSFNDNIPVGTVYIPGTIRVITNEGKIYKQFTDAAGDDEGWIVGTTVRINLGYNQTDAPATSFRRGRLRNTHKPSFFNSACIMVASYQVTVVAGLGSIINIGAGNMTYRPGVAPVVTYTLPSNRVMVYTNMGMCTNTVGANSLGTEFNGSFGSGKPRNRGTSANVPPSYTYAIFSTNTPNDYNYGIANNTSTRTNYTTSNGWAKPDASVPTHRVFGVWDIIGDHTGAVSPTLGNPAADTIINNNGGYMLVVNASYRIDSAFQHTVSGLCPNTYYEISFWMRNICSKCGCDSNGKGASDVGYLPTVVAPPGTADSSGVYPNITFEVDGLDYYSTGNLKYSGLWVKKGFTFLTGPIQNSFTLKLFNNAPGGGGNDWALDDIAVATCYPNLSVTPSTFNGCAGNPVYFGATVSSFFDNYNYYKWEKSTDGGLSWASTGVSGIATPTISGGQYVYTADYPPFLANLSDNGVRYRIVVGTTALNLSNTSCSYTDATNITTLHIIDCFPLPMGIENFRGWLNGDKVLLGWQTVNEFSQVDFYAEKSNDGINFHEIGNISGTMPGSGNGNYQFTDPEKASGTNYYRLKISDNGKISYSSTVMINTADHSAWTIHNVVNPFNNTISIQASIPSKGKMAFILTDTYGRLIQKSEQVFEKGMFSHSISVNPNVITGIYILTVQYENRSVNVKLMKR
jgi:trimeric autotransporter adhesin